MAIVATAVTGLLNSSLKAWTITALDADTTVDVTHGLPSTPLMVFIQPLVSYASTALPSWGVTVVDSTKITLVKTTATASGGATPGTTVIAKLFALLPSTVMQ